MESIKEINVLARRDGLGHHHALQTCWIARVNQNFKPSQDLQKKTLKATDVDFMAASKTPQNTPGSPTAVNAPDMVK